MFEKKFGIKIWNWFVRCLYKMHTKIVSASFQWECQLRKDHARVQLTDAPKSLDLERVSVRRTLRLAAKPTQIWVRRRAALSGRPAHDQVIAGSPRPQTPTWPPERTLTVVRLRGTATMTMILSLTRLCLWKKE